MTAPISVMGFFCEDIREEKNDSYTVIGMMPDNAEAVGDLSQEGQKVLPKICLFLRVNFDAPIGEVTVHLVVPGRGRQKLGVIDAALTEKALADAIHKGNPMAGVIFRAIMALQLFESGPFKVEAEIAGETYLAAALNVNIVPNAPNASAPPSEQSLSASALIRISP